MSSSYLIGNELEPGLLSSPQIEYCLKKYKILMNAEESNIKAGVYAMRLGDYATRWESGIKLEFKLDLSTEYKIYKKIEKITPRSIDLFRKKNSLRYLELPPNSLTFVTTIEQFNLARNLIARFNLKSSWVHKGLLLGTGPIVDPGFRSKIVIPLHNFSNNYIYIEYGTQLINVEFTITHDPEATLINGITVSALKNSTSDKPVIEYFKGSDYTESSIRSNIDSMRSSIKIIKNFGFVAIGAFAISFMGLLFYVLDIARDSKSLTSSTRSYVESVKKDIQSGDISEINSLKRDLRALSAQIKALEVNDSNTVMIDTLSKRISELESKIDKLIGKKGDDTKIQKLP